MKKENRGGARIGSGRPKKDPTTTVAFRVPVEHAPAIKAVVKKTILKLTKKEDHGQNKM